MLTMLAIIVVLVLVAFGCMLLANAFCNPTMGNSVNDRMVNRAKRELEQELYKFITMLMLGAFGIFVLIIAYLFF